MDVPEFHSAALVVGFFVCFALGFFIARATW